MIEMKWINGAPEKLEWKIAKTKKNKQLYEYTILKWKTREPFLILKMGIEAFGEEQVFYADKNRYLTINEYTYWVVKRNESIICRRKNDLYKVDVETKEIRKNGNH